MDGVCPQCGRAAPGVKAQPKRDAQIVRLHKRGQSAEQIGVAFKLTATRVRQIVRKATRS